MSLLAGAFLAGLAVLAVPLWLHRLNERAPPEGSVSSLMLMREAEEPKRTRRSLAHRLLLALRLALLAALTFAFAQPVLLSVAADAGSDAGRQRLIVLDASLSMRRAWPDALAQAEALREAGDRLATIGDRLTMIDDLDAASPGWSRLDFAGLFGRIEAGLAALPEPLGGWEIHLISDFQASAVPPRFNALIEGLSRPAVLHPVGAGQDNWALAAGELGNGRIEATLTSFAAAERWLAVALRRGGSEVQRASVAVVEAGAHATVSFDAPPAERAAVAWELRIEAGDALPEDDVLHIVQAPLGATTVAVVAPNADPDAVRFLVAALEANGIAAPIRVAEGDPWPRADAAIVLDPGGLAGPLQRRVERYLDGGGGALLIAGPRTERAGSLWSDPVAVVDDGAARRVLVADTGHALAGEGWGEVTVSRWLAAGPEAAFGTVPAVLTVASESGGEAPLLTERRVGKGRLVMLLTALDRDWSTLVLRPAFVGLVGNAVDYLAANVPLAARAGEPVAIAAASAQIFDAAGERVLGLGETATGRRLVRVAAPGFYTVRAPGREAMMAVNVDVQESDLTPLSAAELQRWQAAAQRAAPAAALAPEDGAEPSAFTPLARWLLGLAALLLVAEALAANIGQLRWRDLRPAS